MPPVKVNFNEVEENEDVFQLPNSPIHQFHLEETITTDDDNNHNSRNEENDGPEPDEKGDRDEEDAIKDDVTDEPEPKPEDENGDGEEDEIKDDVNDEDEDENGDGEEEEEEEEDEIKDDVNGDVVDNNNSFISAEDVGNVLFRLIRSIHISDDPDQNNSNNNNEEIRRSESSSSDDDENYNKNKFVHVSLSDIRKEVQCPICLGIIRKTRTVMECLHRFCRECIDKSIRMGNKECPACRTHCPSRRSLRDDANFDALIAAIFPDIDQYEEEELLFQEDEEARNKQIQASIAQTLHRQTEALTKKRKRSQITYRRRRNYRAEDEVDTHDHDGGKSRWSKRWRGQPSPASASGDGGDNEHDQEAHKEPLLASVGLVGCSDRLAWGKGGLRSNFRYTNGKHSRNRLTKLGDHLRNLHENDSELEIQVVLIPLDQQKPSGLHHSFLCSRPTLSVEQLCQFIAFQTSQAPERLEILAAKGPSSKSRSFTPVQGQASSLCALEACIDDLQVLDSEETLGGLRASCNFNQGHLRLAYRQKAST